jgi:CRP-like cAMP-binding protein
VISGAFALETAPNEREPNLVHLFRPGFWFGESEQYDKRPRFTTIVATRDSLCLRISQSRLEEFVSAHPEFWRWFGLLSIQHLLLALEVIDDTLQRDPGHRIEALLLRLANQRGRNVTGDPRPEIDATQSELAHLTNISRATVAAHLKLLEENGLVAREYGRLVILNPTRLRDRLRQRLDS